LQVLNAMMLGVIESDSPMDVALTKRLLTAGAAADTWAPSGLSALMIASSLGKVEVMELLINRQRDACDAVASEEYDGADVQLADGQRRTALIHAAEKNNVAAIQLLLTHGAQVQHQLCICVLSTDSGLPAIQHLEISSILRCYMVWEAVGMRCAASCAESALHAHDVASAICCRPKTFADECGLPAGLASRFDCKVCPGLL
jgi:Ankyrin repeats (3 copies)